MITAILLNYQGKIKDATPFFPTGTDAKLIVDQKGIGQACNDALNLAFEVLGSDYCIILANDIIEPEDTIQRRLKAFEDPEVGIVSINTKANQRNKVYLAGNFMISKKLFEEVGYFTTEWDESYGPVDLQYCVRSFLAGYKNVNLNNVRAKHTDNGDTAYGYSKKEVLRTTYPEFKAWETQALNSPKDYIYLPYNQK